MSKITLKLKLLLAIILPSVAMGFIAFGQNFDISGKVIGPDKKPVSFATVIIQGTSIGTNTDLDGLYKLSVPVEYKDSSLTFSFVGYADKSVAINSQSSIDVSMEEVVDVLSAVTVVGYGTQKTSDVTGAVSSVSAKEIEKAPVLSVGQALQGRLAGVQITQNSGSPNSALSIRVRGVGTVGNSDPLYVVDGFPMNDISYLNPTDIASIDVLKDASASAIYGARGANGVVIITTKRGKGGGRTTLDYNGYAGVQEAWKKLNLMDAQSWAKTVNAANAADGLAPKFSNPDSLGKGTDWQDQIFRKAYIQSHQLSLIGGNEKNSFAVSGSYFSQDGIIHKTDAKRYNFRANVDHQFNPKLKIGEGINLSHLSNNQITENDEYNSVIADALRIDPITPVFGPDGSTYSYSSISTGSIVNPSRALAYTNNKWVTDRVVGNVFAEYEFIKGLKFKSNAGINASFVNNYQFNPTYSLYDASIKSYVIGNAQNLTTREFQSYINTLWDNTLSYSKIIKKNHSLDLVLGISYQNEKQERFNANKQGVPSNDPSVRYFDASNVQTGNVGGTAAERTLFGYLGRLNYSFKERYLLTTNIRIDKSSRFRPGNRTGVFPSFSAGWIISKEQFMQNLALISTLKVRAGWGQIGNENIGSFYPYTTSINNAAPDGTNLGYTFGGVYVAGSAPLTGANKNIKWETTTSTNIGLNVGLWRDRLSFTADYYIRNTSDMLVQVPVPGYVGINTPAYVNAGSVQNKGLELSSTYRKAEGKFQYGVSGNISFVKNKVTSLGNGGQYIPGANSGYFAGNISRTDVGQPIASFYGYKTNGIYQNQEEINASPSAQVGTKPGDIRYVTDKDGNRIQTYIGSPIPKFTYGLNLNASYSNFDLSVFFQGVQGNKLFNLTRYTLESGGARLNSFLSTESQAWTPTNTNTDIPRLTALDKNGNNLISDRYVEDGSYLRLKTIQLGYTIPAKLLEKMRIQKIRFYISAQNLLTFTKYKGYDPEIGNRNSLDIGVDRGIYPQARVYTLGGNFTF